MLTGWDAGPDRDEVMEELLDTESGERLMGQLTKRQRQVAALLVQGYTRREIADHFGISLMAIHRMVLRMRSRLRSQLPQRTMT